MSGGASVCCGLRSQAETKMSELLPCNLAYEGKFDELKKLISEDPTQATALDEVCTLVSFFYHPGYAA